MTEQSCMLMHQCARQTLLSRVGVSTTSRLQQVAVLTSFRPFSRRFSSSCCSEPWEDWNNYCHLLPVGDPTSCEDRVGTSRNRHLLLSQCLHFGNYRRRSDEHVRPNVEVVDASSSSGSRRTLDVLEGVVEAGNEEPSWLTDNDLNRRRPHRRTSVDVTGKIESEADRTLTGDARSHEDACHVNRGPPGCVWRHRFYLYSPRFAASDFSSSRSASRSNPQIVEPRRRSSNAPTGKTACIENVLTGSRLLQNIKRDSAAATSRSTSASTLTNILNDARNVNIFMKTGGTHDKNTSVGSRFLHSLCGDSQIFRGINTSDTNRNRSLQKQTRSFLHAGGSLSDDEDGYLALSESQEGILLERLPAHWAEEDILAALNSSPSEGQVVEPLTVDDILLMRSRLGRSMQRAIVRHRTPGGPGSVAQLKQLNLQRGLGVTSRAMDRHDVRLFVEQVEAFERFSDDLHFLARPEHFQRTVTISNVPKSYGRKDVLQVLKTHCDISDVPHHHVVFQFKRFGVQSDVCFVVLNTVRQAERVLST